MKYSIIIPTYNKCDELLRPCIDSILAYTTVNVPDHAEIIVVANGCTDNTREYITEKQQKYHNIHLIWRNEAIGYTKAINIGMKYAKGEFFVLLNNDTILLNQQYNEWLEVLALPFRTLHKVGITGPMKVPNDGTGLPFLIFFCVMISSRLYKELGPLDEVFSPGYGEDTDYCLKAEALGYSIVQVPEDSNNYYAEKRMTGNFPIYHAGNQTFKDYPDAELINRNNQILIDRYGNRTKIVEEFLEGVNIEQAKKCDGYMADSELEWLAKTAQSIGRGDIIEVGSWHGKSSRAIADNMPTGTRLFCVDHWRGSASERDNNHQSAAWEDGDHAYLEFIDNLYDHISQGWVFPIRLSSKNAAQILDKHGLKAKIIFIDAGHTKEEVLADLDAWLPLVEEGGIICGHDAYHMNNPWPGVLEAVKEQWYDKYIEQAPNTSIWVVRDPNVMIKNKRYPALPTHVNQYPILKAPVVRQVVRQPCVFDCFPFNNEIDILKERFEKLYDTVDRFVIVEAKETHGGKPKELTFEANLDKFQPFLSKITYMVIEEFPKFEGSITDKSWARERYQRDYLMNGLKDLQDNDIVIISDCDEIPTPEAIKSYIKTERNTVCGFEMDLYYYNKHTRAKDKWTEAKITTYNRLKELGPCGIRYYKAHYNIPNGGEHLSYFGGVKAIVKKIEDTAHQEYNTDYFKNDIRIRDIIQDGKDIFERDRVKFETV